MSSDELVRLKEFMNNTDYPLLVSNFPSELYEGAVTLESDIDVTLLNGHYEGINYEPPHWFKVLEENAKLGKSLLIINNIDDLALDEQMKFGEILKYRKISTFDLPKNVQIIVTIKPSGKVVEDIYSLLVHI